MGSRFILLIVALVLPMSIDAFAHREIDERSVPMGNINVDDYPDYPAKYGEYPVVSRRSDLGEEPLFRGYQEYIDNQQSAGGAEDSKSQTGHQPAQLANSRSEKPSPDSDTIVVPKRAALLFDQLMVALQKVVDNQQNRGELGGGSGIERSRLQLPATSSQLGRSIDAQTMDLQRRGQPKGRVYWRCYFNAVTCFKRK